MSGLQTRNEDPINGVDVREQGSALRVATNTPHLVSLGTGRLSTAVTLHPIKQGRVTIGSDPTCDIYVVGTGVASVHCRVENSHGVVTLYPLSGSTLLDGLPVDKPTRLSQGSMLTIGRSNYLRFNHPAEAKLMKSVLPSAHVSMAPVQFTPNEQCIATGYMNHTESYQTANIHKIYKDNSLNQLDQELDITLKEMSRKKPPVAPKKPYRDLDQSDSNSDQESKPKMTGIMAKVSKFEYYAKQQKVGRSQFYTSNENEISPKVFSANSLTVNTPAKDVLGGKTMPNYMNKLKNISVNENNAIDPKNSSYSNVAKRNKTKIDDIVKNFNEPKDYNRLPKKINNDQQNENIYGKINVDRKTDEKINQNGWETGKNTLESTKNTFELEKNNFESGKNTIESGKNNLECYNSNILVNNEIYGRISDRNVNLSKGISLPSPAYDRNPQYSPVYANSLYDRGLEAENRRLKAYQERVKEEEQKEAETARLEEILNMCAEYERQIATGIPITPPEKRPHNKIITNGSLPRSTALNNPNFVQTSDGYYKFDTSHNKNPPLSSSLPIQRNLSSYENFEVSPPTELTPEVVISQNNYENIGRMDEIGIPVFDSPSPKMHELSSPIMIRKLHNQSGDRNPNLSSPIGSPYENVYYRNNVYGNLKPISPNTQSPRTRIKTTFAHKNLPSPQYFIFPTPPPVDNANKPNFEATENQKTEKDSEKPKFDGIEKQLSLEEEIPMIDDDLTNDIELRYSKIVDDKKESNPEKTDIVKNQSFDDMKNELMADIPELEEFEKDLKENKREKILKNISEDIKKIDIEADSIDSTVLDDNVDDLKLKYDKLKDDRKKFVTEIHEIKCKMSEIRSQEDDILRELEMEKALIKGEYDSEIAILNIEQKKKADLVDSAKKIEEEIRQLKQKQEARQNEMRDRVEIATLKSERIEKDLSSGTATLEELQNAQDILDNETKIFEDLEFQHLEEESELLSNREDIQNEIMLLTKKIEAQKSRILTLKSEANNNLTSALDETKILHAEYVNLLNRVEVLTSKVQAIEKELKPIVAKLNEIERTQSPDSAFYTDQTRAKSGEFGYSPQSSDSDDIDLKISTFEDHTKLLKDKFNSIDQMSQSMTVDLERRVITDLIDTDDRYSESPSKSSTSSKEKKGFWERNFDSLKRKNKKPKSPEKVDIMSQSLNENFFYNDNIETDLSLDKFNSLRHSKKKEKNSGPVKSNSSSKIPTFAALGKIMKKDSFGKKSKENSIKNDESDKENNSKSRYIKNPKPISLDNKYIKAKSLSPDKREDDIKEENENIDLAQQKTKVTFETTSKIDNFIDNAQAAKILHRKSCGDEPNIKSGEFQKIADTNKIPSQDDIDRISKVTIDAPILSSDTDVNSLGKRTLDSLMEVERKRLEMLEEQGCQVIENEREKILELKRRVQDETKKLWDQKYRSEQTKSFDSADQPHSLPIEKTGSIVDDSSLIDDSFIVHSSIFEDSSGLLSSSIEEKRPYPGTSKIQRVPDSTQSQRKQDLTPEEFEEQKELFLSNLNIDDVRAREIEQNTKGQSDSDLWLEERRKRLTASNFGRICKLKEKTSVKGILNSLLYSTFNGNKATRYGKENEHKAIEQFSKETNLSIINCGLFIDNTKPFLGASPDGLINEDSIVEVKCPYKIREMTPKEGIEKKEIDSCELYNNTLKLKRNNNYYYQVQGQLHITRRQFCYFIVWSPKGLLYEKIEKDDTFWTEKMEPILKCFYYECYLPERIDPCIPRGLPVRERITFFPGGKSNKGSSRPSTSTAEHKPKRFKALDSATSTSSNNGSFSPSPSTVGYPHSSNTGHQLDSRPAQLTNVTSSLTDSLVGNSIHPSTSLSTSNAGHKPKQAVGPATSTSSNNGSFSPSPSTVGHRPSSNTGQQLDSRPTQRRQLTNETSSLAGRLERNSIQPSTTSTARRGHGMAASKKFMKSWLDRVKTTDGHN